MDGAASYVEVLTCLEMDQAVKKLRPKANTASDVSEPDPKQMVEKIIPSDSPRSRHRGISLHLRLRRQPLQHGFLAAIFQLFCLPGLNAVLPGCVSSAGNR